MNDVVVITPTIGRPELSEAIASVMNQTQPAQHLIVVDGPEYDEAVSNIISSFDNTDHIAKLVLPYNTGRGEFYGHRALASVSHILKQDYILLLDDDNWYDNNHIQSLIVLLQDEGLDFAYSFRKVWSNDKSFSVLDNSMSIGTVCDKINPEDYMLDTSSYIFTGDFFGKNGWQWHYGWGADRRFFNLVQKDSVHNSTRLHTMNYRLSASDVSDSIDLITYKNKEHSECTTH